MCSETYSVDYQKVELERVRVLLAQALKELQSSRLHNQSLEERVKVLQDKVRELLSE